MTLRGWIYVLNLSNIGMIFQDRFIFDSKFTALFNFDVYTLSLNYLYLDRVYCSICALFCSVTEVHCSVILWWSMHCFGLSHWLAVLLHTVNSGGSLECILTLFCGVTVGHSRQFTGHPLVEQCTSLVSAMSSSSSPPSSSSSPPSSSSTTSPLPCPHIKMDQHLRWRRRWVAQMSLQLRHN